MKREHLYVERKHPCVRLMVLFLAASAVASVVVTVRGGLDILWGLVVPCAAAVLFALTAFFSGDEMLFRTAVPMWLLGISIGAQYGTVPVWAGGLLLCLVYSFALSGRIPRAWLAVLCVPALVGLGFLRNIPGLLMVLGVLLMTPAVRVHKDGKWHPAWGDRIEGRRVRTAQVMEQITAYFMPTRTGASNLFSESVEITELERYIRRKRREGMTGFSITHAVLAAYVRTVAKFPALNRFVAGQRIYSRGKDIAVCMTVKKELTAEAPDSLIKVHLDPTDTASDVYRKFNERVENAKNEMETTADATVAGFMAVPRLLLKAVILLLRFMDYFGLIPRFLLEISPFHGSVYFTNLGSLGIKPIFHHLYDFGTVPAFCAFGRKRRAEEIKDGEVVDRKYLDMTFNLDERICDGFYYSSVIKYFLRLLSHPDVLDEAPEEVREDIP